MGASHASEATPMIEWILTEMWKGTGRNTAKFNSLTQVPQADGTHMSHTHNKPRASCDADCSQCEQTQGVCCQVMSSMIASITSWVVNSGIVHWQCLVLFEIIFVPATWNHATKTTHQSLSPVECRACVSNVMRASSADTCSSDLLADTQWFVHLLQSGTVPKHAETASIDIHLPYKVSKWVRNFTSIMFRLYHTLFFFGTHIDLRCMGNDDTRFTR